MSGSSSVGRYADSQIHFHSNLCLQDFDSIFGTLLPNTNAKLEPPQGMDETEGLEIKAWIHLSVFSILAVSLSELTGCIPWSLEAVPDRAQWWTTIASCTFPGLGTFALQASTDVPRFRFRDFELNWYWGNFICWASSFTPKNNSRSTIRHQKRDFLLLFLHAEFLATLWILKLRYVRSILLESVHLGTSWMRLIPLWIWVIRKTLATWFGPIFRIRNLSSCPWKRGCLIMRMCCSARASLMVLPQSRGVPFVTTTIGWQCHLKRRQGRMCKPNNSAIKSEMICI